MTPPSSPKLPIPTSLAWLLLESTQQGSWSKKVAQIAAIGAKILGKDEGRTQTAFYKMLTKLQAGHQPRSIKIEALVTALRIGGRYNLQQSRNYSGEQIDLISDQLDSAAGPFTILSASYVPKSANHAWQHLHDFSNNLDHLGSAFADAKGKDDLDAAKDLLLQPNWLDESYWSFPEPGMEDSLISRRALRAATDWEELTRAAAPLVLNTTLAWLSWLDLVVVTSGRNPSLEAPLFLPLATRFTPEAAALLRLGKPLLAGDWSENVELPVPNLIRMLKSIVAVINQNLQKRPKPPIPRYFSTQDREGLSGELKKFSREDMLSIEQFNRLLNALGSDDLPRSGEGCGFDIYALHKAANLFSLLTPRDGIVPKNDSRRKRPQSITICEDIPTVYERWWQRNKKDMAQDAV